MKRLGTSNERKPAAGWGTIRRFRPAFTLLELLVVIAVIGILAALLLPVLAAAKRRAGQVQCINNLHQLGLGMQMYVNDYRDTFPGQASEHSGFQASDWIWWRTNDPAHPVEKSPIVIELAHANPKLFRCPLDTDNSARIQYAKSDPQNGPYLYSYSLTSYDLVGSDNGNGDVQYVNPGMSSDFTGGQHLPFTLSEVMNPSAKIMLAEEPGSDDPRDNPTGAHVINDGRWVPSEGDPLTSRHGGKGDVTFADFHVEPVTSAFADSITNSRPDL